MTGWIVVAVGFVGLGLGAVVGAQRAQVRELPAVTIQAWRQYAGEVERGTRTPSGVTTRLLTEAAIAQHALHERLGFVATNEMQFSGSLFGADDRLG
jgi:predicted component of type VI protein secretion system